MKRGLIFAIGILAHCLVSCAKRPITARIVFVPSTPPPALTASAEAIGALIVAEPQGPAAEEPPGPPAPEPAEKLPARPRVRLAPADPAAEPESEPAPAEVPALEPREGPAAQAAQRQQVLQLLDQIRARATRQEKASLTASERRMLGDARTFLSQSERALAASDFQRARTLARKASMLLAVVEQQ